MAVVAQLSVNLAAQTAAYEQGLKKASKETDNFVARTQRSMAKLRKSFGNIGGRLSPLGLGPGAITGLGAGFMAQRFARNSLSAFSETKDGAQLKSAMDGLNKSVMELEVNFGRWLDTTLGVTSGLKTLKAAADTLGGTGGAEVNAGVAARTQALADDPVRKNAERQLRENLKAQAAIQQQIKDSADAMASGGLFRQMTRLFTDPMDAANIRQLETQLATLEMEASALRPAAGFTGTSGGGLMQRSGGATLPEGGMPGFLNAIPQLIDDGLKGFAELSRGAVSQLDKIDSAFGRLESSAQDLMAGFKITEGQRSPLEQFERVTAELKRLNEAGFLGDDAFNLALLQETRNLEQFAGLNDPLPGRMGGRRRGSAEAFEVVARHTDNANNPVQRTLDETKEIAKRQEQHLKDIAKGVRQQFDRETPTMDPKP